MSKCSYDTGTLSSAASAARYATSASASLDARRCTVAIANRYDADRGCRNDAAAGVFFFFFFVVVVVVVVVTGSHTTAFAW
jgi:hypothetical protein